MRERICRGKRIDNREWIEGYYLPVTPHDGNVVHYIINIDGHKFAEVDPETLGVFSGFDNKMGVRIFTGDIIKASSNYMGITMCGDVVFKDGCYGIRYLSDFSGGRFHRIGLLEKWQDMGMSGVIQYSYEVIGNIHDTPELIDPSILIIEVDSLKNDDNF